MRIQNALYYEVSVAPRLSLPIELTNLTIAVMLAVADPGFGEGGVVPFPLSSSPLLSFPLLPFPLPLPPLPYDCIILASNPTNPPGSAMC